MNLFLIGAPNTGKTTLFNSMTKRNEHTGNWHGVTVDEKQAPFRFENQTHFLSDLPGTYSLSAFSYEEEVTQTKLFSSPKTQVINICQSQDLERNLLLTLELLEFGVKPLVFINQIAGDQAQISESKLSSLLQTKVVVGSAQSKNIKQLICSALHPFSSKPNLDYLDGLPLEEIALLIQENARIANLPANFCAIKLYEKDEQIAKKLKLSLLQLAQLNSMIPTDSIGIISERRNQHVKKMVQLSTKNAKKTTSYHKKVDKWLLSNLWSYPIFFAVITCVLLLSFYFLGQGISSFLGLGVEILEQKVLSLVSPAGNWLTDFVQNAVFAGAFSLLDFCGQIVCLFLCLALLEDSGYFSRVAFVWEDFLQKIGLNGRSIYSIILGFGCSASAFITARSASDKSAKLKTIFLIPFMSCSAKLPVFLLFATAFFASSVWFLFAVLLLSASLGVVFAFVLNKFFIKQTTNPFLFELAPLRMPSFKRAFQVMLTNMKHFFARIFGIVLLASILFWFVQNHSFALEYIPNSFHNSILYHASQTFAPIFLPLGLASAGMVAALLSGLIAKEVTLSVFVLLNVNSILQGMTLAQSISNPSSVVSFGLQTAICFLVFFSLYTPCITALAVCKKEYGTKFMFAMFIFQTLIAYAVTMVVYFILNVSFALFAIPLVVLFFLVLSSLFKKNKCVGCTKSCYGCLIRE